MNRGFRCASETEGVDSITPSELKLFALALLGKPLPDTSAAKRRVSEERERLEWLASFSERHAEQFRLLELSEAKARRDRERLEWLAQISERHERKLREVLREEAEAKEAQTRAERYAEALIAQEAWDAAKHPRRGGAPNAGWFASTGGGGDSGGSSMLQPAPIHTLPFRNGQSSAHITALGGGGAATWPASGSASRWLRNAGSGAGAAVGAGTGLGLSAFFGALRNASMGAYWARVPAVQAMPEIWVYELEKRVRAGTLSREDARGIFATAVLGAEAQGFKPTGDRFSLVHKSAVDFLAKAEAVYFARKKQSQGWATQKGGYQQSGGRVFPTKQNSGLDGYALRREQEDFFKRGLAQGHDPEYLRGQASVAGEKRLTNPDRLQDPELEAALQRAIEQSKKSTK